jgi:CRISPR system Cascade subunit CasA
MPKLSGEIPSFNLWTEAWITLERLDGTTERCGIADALLHAHEYGAIYDPSPLVSAGIQRLLVAILQGALNPQHGADIKKVLAAGCFSQAKINAFGKEFAHRFDLFSAPEPFLQSADLPLQPAKGDKLKTVAYLLPEVPSGTEVTHYRHGSEEAQSFCPACAAMGLALIPAFATSGGAGIKPSINGVPPIYVLPGGQTLFESLALSLTIPAYQPPVASDRRDDAWWLRKPIVQKGKEVREVGYLHSLTFPARRVRLHPERLAAPCTHCGRMTEWGVRTMIFEMGESRPKDAPFWFDPFAAYRITEGKPPVPIRPLEGKATWREFGGLFLQDAKPATTGKKKVTLTHRPSVIDQMAAFELRSDVRASPFRCVGLRTDMKAKIFEWLDAGFEVPPRLLADPASGLQVREAIAFATECAATIAAVFKGFFGGSSKKQERFAALKSRMLDDYWSALAGPFRLYVLEMGESANAPALRDTWTGKTIEIARASFLRAAEEIGDDAASLRERVRAEARCNYLLSTLKRQQAGGEPNDTK